MLASVRTHAAFYVAFVAPSVRETKSFSGVWRLWTQVTELRYLAGSSHKLRDWSPFSMARVVDVFEGWMVRGARNGQVILDLVGSGRSAFAAIATEQPAFHDYRKHEAAATKKSPDEQTTHAWLKLVRAELATPRDASNAGTTERTLEFIEVCCARLLVELRDPHKRTWRYLRSQNGDFAWGTDAARAAHADTTGCYAQRSTRPCSTSLQHVSYDRSLGLKLSQS